MISAGPDYLETDAHMRIALAGGPLEFEALVVQIDGIARFPDPPEWRLIERRLHAMRDAGKVQYTPVIGWQLTGES